MVTQRETPSTADAADTLSDDTVASVHTNEVVDSVVSYEINDAGEVERTETSVAEQEGEEAAPTAEAESTETPEETPSELEATEETPEADEPDETDAPTSITDSPEYRQLQSSFDRRVAALERQQREAERQYQEQLAASQIESQVEAHRRELRDHYERLGVSPEEYAARVEQAAENHKKALEGAAAAERASAAQVTSQRQQAYGTLTDWAGRLKTDHSLPDPVEASLRKVAAVGVLNLSNFTDAEGQPSEQFSAIGQAMAEIAEEVGKVIKENSQRQQVQQRRAQVPAGGPENSFDSGGAQAGALTDDQKIAAFAAGESDNYEEAMEILRKRNQMPF